MTSKVQIYGDLKTEYTGRFTLASFNGKSLGTCNEDVSPKKYMRDIHMFMYDAKIAPEKLAILKYLTDCYDQAKEPTQKDFEKQELMEALSE